jgi:hypothetical protein
MRWNIQNYYGKAAYKQDMQLYENILEKQDVSLAIGAIGQYLDLAKNPAKLSNQKVGQYDLRNVEAAIICYLALEKVSDNTDLKNNWRQKIEEVEQIAQIKNGKKFAD